MDKEFLGTGMKFPPQINKVTGRFVTSSGSQSVKEAIYLILMTQKTERWIRPEFGSSIMSYTFMDMNPTMMNIMIRNLKGDILLQEPRIDELEITADTESKQGCLILNLNYRITEKNTRENLVFPFYLVGQEEEME